MYHNPPYIEIPSSGKGCSSGWDDINMELEAAIRKIDKKKVVLVVECHHGAFEEVNFNALKRGLTPNASCKSSHIFKDKEEIQKMVTPFISPEGKVNQYTGLGIQDYFDENKRTALHNNIDFIEEGLVLIFGIGASLIWEADILVYADMSQWEVQQRFKRHDIDNIGLPNSNDNFDEQYRLAFFNDWPLCNQIRNSVLSNCDFYLETNNWAKPKLVKGAQLRQGLLLATQRPFRIAPFYDPLLWDESAQTDQEEPNIEWYFSCVPEEGNLLFKTAETLFEVPLLSLIASYPEQFLGKLMMEQFGNNFPIYLDFIDTQDTGTTNFQLLSSLDISQLNPERFYYFLEAEDISRITTGQFNLQASTTSSTNQISFQSKTEPIRPHDYISIPNEISIQIGEQVIALFISNVSNKFVQDINPGQFMKNNGSQIELMTKQQTLKGAFSLQHSEVPYSTDSIQNDTLSEGHIQTLEITRVWFQQNIEQQALNNAHVINLIEGDHVEISSPENRFSKQTILHGETFIIPANCGSYLLTAPPDQKTPCAILWVTARLA